MALGEVVEGFSLSHAQILDGATAFTAAVATDATTQDVYGVNDASLDPDQDSYENEGDDTVLSTWNWLNFAEVTIQAGYVSFPLIASLTGRTISSSGTGSNVFRYIDLWHQDSFNVAPKPMLIRMPAKDANGVVRTLDIGLYRVQFMPITFDGPAYKDGLKINYGGRCLMSPTDELGVAHTDGKKKVGRLIDRPAV